MTEKEEIEMLKAKIVLYYFHKKRYEQGNEQIMLKEHELYDLKGVTYDKLPMQANTIDVHAREHKLAKLTEEVAMLRSQVATDKNESTALYVATGLCCLDDVALKIMDCVGVGESYTTAGVKLGYSKKQVYRIMSASYKKCLNYIQGVKS